MLFLFCRFWPLTPDVCTAFFLHTTTLHCRLSLVRMVKSTYGCDVVWIPAAQQAVEDSDQQFAWHRQPSSSSSKSLESPFSSIRIHSLNFGKSSLLLSACLDAPSRCHVIGWGAPCGYKQLNVVPNELALHALTTNICIPFPAIYCCDSAVAVCNGATSAL